MYIIKYSLQTCIYLVFFVLLFYCYLAKTYAFTDDFTSDPSGNPNWNVQNSNGLVFNNPGITLTSSLGSFPYLKTSSSNPLGENRYHEITFQYLNSSSDWGVGASFSDNSPNYPTYLGTVSDYLKYNMFYFFGNHLHTVSTICPKEMQACPNNWWFTYPNSPPTNNYLSSTPRDFGIHTYSLIREDSPNNFYTYKVYLDKNLIVETQPTTRLVNSIWIGHPSNLGLSRIWPELKILSVKSLPIPPNSFPYLSQKDPAWASKEYDSAKTWGGLDRSGIDHWGCALTSVVMVLQNYKVNALDGSAVTPDELNDWLKSQPDGYIGPGLLNWLAVTRYVKESYQAGHADSKLEYVRGYSPDNPVLPAIIGVPGHFVVAHGEDATSWGIKDPANASISTLSKTSVVRSFNRFVPSHTDLSYMLFVTKPGTNVIIKNSSGAPVPLTWENEYLDDDVSGSPSPTLQTALVPKPSSDTYTVSANNASVSSSNLDTYLYTAEGDTHKTKWIIQPQETKILDITFDKQIATASAVMERDVVPPEIPTLIFPTENAATNSAYVSFDWTDSNEISSYTLKLLKDNADYVELPTASASAHTTLLPDGHYSWAVKACDISNNCSDWSKLWSLQVDTTAPQIPTLPIAIASNPASTPIQTWTWEPSTDATSVIAGYSTKTYDVRKDSYLTDWFWLGNVLSAITTLGEGEWQFLLKSMDSVGNESEIVVSESLTVDMTAPILASHTIFGDNWYNSNQISSFEYSDSNLPSDYVDPSCKIDTESSASYCWIQPYVCDKAGNCTGTQVFSQTIKLDKTKPTLTLDTWGHEMTGKVNDNLSGVDRVVIQITRPGMTEETFNVNPENGIWKYVMENIIFGEYRVKVSAYDNANNSSDLLEKAFNISNSEENNSPATSSVLPTSAPSPNESVLGKSVLGKSVQSSHKIDSQLSSLQFPPSLISRGEEVLGLTDQNDYSKYPWVIFTTTGIVGILGLFIFRAKKK